MSSNIERERDIRHRLVTDPTATADDLRWLLTETARLRDAAADEYQLRLAADDAAMRALAAKTAAVVTVGELRDRIGAQSAEIADLAATVRKQGKEIATLRGFPGMVIVDA